MNAAIAARIAKPHVKIIVRPFTARPAFSGLNEHKLLLAGHSLYSPAQTDLTTPFPSDALARSDLRCPGGYSMLLTVWRAIFFGFVQWVGEAFIGVVPWLAYILTHSSSTENEITALCPKSALLASGQYFQCNLIPESPAQEICILAVVISGLSALSVGQFMPGRRQAPRTALTYFLMVLSMGSLISGAIFYAQISTHHHPNLEQASYLVLAIALFSSLILALQEAVLTFQSGISNQKVM